VSNGAGAVAAGVGAGGSGSTAISSAISPSVSISTLTDNVDVYCKLFLRFLLPSPRSSSTAPFHHGNSLGASTFNFCGRLTAGLAPFLVSITIQDGQIALPRRRRRAGITREKINNDAIRVFMMVSPYANI
jgi:hypothetical protein